MITGTIVGAPQWVAALDETIHDDSELLDWFQAATWWDLSVALSMAVGAEIEFPDREEPMAPDSGHFEMTVYDESQTVTYPIAITDLIGVILEQADSADGAQPWRSLAQEVRTIEGFPIAVSRTLFAPHDNEHDDVASTYRYRRSAPHGWTLARWKKARLASHVPAHRVLSIAWPDGRPVVPQTRLSTLRRAWRDAPDPAALSPTDPTRVFEVMRQARWTAYVLSTCA